VAKLLTDLVAPASRRSPQCSPAILCSFTEQRLCHVFAADLGGVHSAFVGARVGSFSRSERDQFHGGLEEAKGVCPAIGPSLKIQGLYVRIEKKNHGATYFSVYGGVTSAGRIHGLFPLLNLNSSFGSNLNPLEYGHMKKLRLSHYSFWPPA
jgi:hypothetical protein